MQSKASTNINGNKLNFKCVNFVKENSEMFIFFKNSKDKETNLSIPKISISNADFETS